jgi:hypothetical protein
VQDSAFIAMSLDGFIAQGDRAHRLYNRLMWTCPRCKRAFTRTNQRHACGTGDRADVTRNRPPAIVALVASIEAFAKSLGPVELVARERYVLLRSVKIFADLVVMTDAVRVAVHLGRKVADPMFFKVVADRRHVTHVAMIKTDKQLAALRPLLREAYEFSIKL